MRNKSVTFLVIYFIFFLTFSILLLYLPSISHDFINTLVFVPVFLIVINILYASKDITNRIVFFIFNIAFFTFLLGEVFLNVINQGSIRSFNLSTASYVHSLLSMTLSLLFIFIGYLLASIKIKNDSLIRYEENAKNSTFLKKVRLVSGGLFIFSSIAKAAQLIEIGIFVQTSGYSNYYLNFSSSLPFIVSIFSSFYYICFYVFLATLPAKKHAFPLIGISLIVAALSLTTGQRNGFVLDLLVILIYFIFRNRIAIKKGIEKAWITKKQLLISALLIPVFLTVLYDIGIERFGEEEANPASMQEKIESFFIAQGGSIHVITHGYDYIDKFPQQDILYSLGPIKEYATQNVISRTIFDIEYLRDNRVKYATEGSVYGPALSYMLFPTGYLSGKGMDSSYIAELYHDFGYAGILVVSFLIGLLLKICDAGFVKRWWSFALLIIFIKEIIYLPRTGLFSWFNQIFNFPNILSMSLIVLFALLLNTKTKAIIK